MSGGYDDGYSVCPCFWGKEPGSMVRKLFTYLPDDLRRWRALDAGCGEGKNARALSERNVEVIAIDCSCEALKNAQRWITHNESIHWVRADIGNVNLLDEHFDIVVAYGLLHCLSTREQIKTCISKLGCATKRGGFHVVCTFNSRYQDLSAHPYFNPCLLPHDFYLEQYANWHMLEATDEDLREVHPHNRIPHTHSLTRLIVQKD